MPKIRLPVRLARLEEELRPPPPDPTRALDEHLEEILSEFGRPAEETLLMLLDFLLFENLGYPVPEVVRANYEKWCQTDGPMLLKQLHFYSQKPIEEASSDRYYDPHQGGRDLRVYAQRRLRRYSERNEDHDKINGSP